MKKNESVGILGGGISGLSVAYELHRRGIEVAVYEKSNKPGGVICSERKDGWLTEKGPNTLMVNKPSLWKLLEDLQLTDSLVKAGNSARKRFIVKNRKPVPIPLSAVEFVKSELFSTSAKFRLLKEPFIPASKLDDESISAFITRRLGREPLEYVVNPFVSGIYAGTPETLSVKHTFSRLWELEQSHGSLFRGMFGSRKNRTKTERALISFEEGLGALPQAMHQRLGDAVHCNTVVEKVSRDSEGWKVCLESTEGRSEVRHSLIVSALPAYTLKQILEVKESDKSLEQMSDVPYAPLSVISLGFKRNQVKHLLDGFGMLIPAAEPYRLLGTLFSSSLFPNRAPEGHILLIGFIGGARNPDLAHKSAGELMTAAVQDLSHLLNIHGTPVFANHTYWNRAIPQYELGYEVYHEAVKQLEEEQPGLLLSGNFLGGVSVPDCIENGIKTARRAIETLTS